MNSIYKIVKSLQNAKGTLEKSAILGQNKDNEMLKAFLKTCYDPSISFYISKVPTVSPTGDNYDFSMGHIEGMLYHLADRTLTGKTASNWLANLSACASDDCRELIHLLIGRSVGAGVGDTMILKVWPTLYFVPPYCRCSLLDDKAKAKFSKLTEFFLQPKLDGSYLALVTKAGEPPKAITRAGGHYPTRFAEKLSKGLPDGFVGLGEVEVFRDDKLLPRQEGNGILNSVLKGGNEEDFAEHNFRLTCWDMLTPEEFKDGKSLVPYNFRLQALYNLLDEFHSESVFIIPNTKVGGLAEAYKIYSTYTAAGMEGAVMKTMDNVWRDGTSKDMVKMKISFEIDLEITAVIEGTGKAKGMMGAVSVQSREGILQSDVGTGWSDEARKYIWSIREQIIGKILTVKANDIISNRNNSGKSLFLPVAIEVRYDKSVADSYEHCVAQLNAAKGLS